MNVSGSIARGSLLSAVTAWVEQAYRWLDRVPYWLLALPLRVAVAWAFWSSAMTHLADWDTTLELFETEYQLPFLPPDPAAYMAVSIEVTTPILLILGLLTRPACLVLLGMTAVIEIFVYPQAWATHIQWAAMLLVLLCRGPGLLSLDWLIRRRLLGKSAMIGRLFALSGLALVLSAFVLPAVARAGPEEWRGEWPRTDFSRHSVAYDEILSGGPSKDGIPAIDQPSFVAVADARGLTPREPVISVAISGETRAYPLRVMIWHEIVNDTVGGTSIAVTWCPLCNSSVAFDRHVAGRTLSFGTTGKLRNSDLIMYDRETESWWQQFGGDCIVGAPLGAALKYLPARVESVERFRARFPQGRVLVPHDPEGRDYGRNPYAGYDSGGRPFLYRGPLPEGVPPLARVVSVGGEAWILDLVKSRRRLEVGDLVITWEPGQNSPLDAGQIDAGQDIGNVVVQRRTARGLEDAVYDVSFAFAFHAFQPQTPIHVK